MTTTAKTNDAKKTTVKAKKILGKEITYKVLVNSMFSTEYFSTRRATVVKSKTKGMYKFTLTNSPTYIEKHYGDRLNTHPRLNFKINKNYTYDEIVKILKQYEVVCRQIGVGS